MSARAGAGLAELLTTMALLGIVGATGAVLVQSQSRLVRHGSERAASAEALRSARAALRGETRDVSGNDIYAIGSDSISMRIFRGTGVVCARTGSRVVIRYRGWRAPDANKDSLLIAGEERAVGFRVSTVSLDCPRQDGERIVVAEPGADIKVGSVLLLFESGAYHLAGNALRYRGGRDGRQPITDELIDHRESRFSPSTQGGIHVQLKARDGAVSTGWLRLANP